MVQESERIIEVREGGKRLKMPAQQALARAMVVGALNGNSHLMRTVSQYWTRIEEDAWDTQNEIIELAADYKSRVTPEFAEQRGAAWEDLVPHPDDIIVDRATRSVEFNGPMTPENKAALDALLDSRSRHEQNIGKLLDGADENPSDAANIIFAMREQDLFDYINEHIPKRLYTTLRRRVTAKEYDAAVKLFKGQHRKVREQRSKSRRVVSKKSPTKRNG